MAVLVQYKMKLYRILRATELRPAIHRQVQIHRLRIETFQLYLELKRHFPDLLVTTPLHYVLIQFTEAMLIGTGKRGTTRCRYVLMLQPVLTTTQPTGNLSQRIGSS